MIKRNIIHTGVMPCVLGRKCFSPMTCGQRLREISLVLLLTIGCCCFSWGQPAKINRYQKTVIVTYSGKSRIVYANFEYPENNAYVQKVLCKKMFDEDCDSIEVAFDRYVSRADSHETVSLTEDVQRILSDENLEQFTVIVGNQNRPDAALADKSIAGQADNLVPVIFSVKKLYTDIKPGCFTYDAGKNGLLSVTDVFTQEAMKKLGITGSARNVNIAIEPYDDKVTFEGVINGNSDYYTIPISKNVSLFTTRIKSLMHGIDSLVMAEREKAHDELIGRLKAEAVMPQERPKATIKDKDKRKIEAFKPQEQPQDTAQAELDKDMAKAQTKAKEQENVLRGVVLEIAEVMPSFPGGDAELMKWLSKNIKYPSIADENGVQGRVIVRFAVDKDGSIHDPKVTRSVDPSLDKEALRVVKAMPRWIPGKQDGKAVAVYFTLPVTFQLQ